MAHESVNRLRIILNHASVNGLRNRQVQTVEPLRADWKERLAA